MSFDSFESSTLGQKALEVTKKRQEEEKKRKEEDAARRLAQQLKDEDWKQFQKEVEADRDKQLAQAETTPAIPRLVRGLPQILGKVPDMESLNTSSPATPPGVTQNAPKLRRF